MPALVWVNRPRWRPLLAVMVHLNQHIAFSDKVLAQEVARSPTLQLLSTAPGVGPVVSTAFVATLDEAQRFNGAHQVESFLALVPSEKSSGEKQSRGAITRAGSRRMHGLLVQSAWTLLRSRSTKTAKLRDWAAKIALRRGKNVAGGGVARRLAGILFAIQLRGRQVQRHQAHPLHPALLLHLQLEEARSGGAPESRPAGTPDGSGARGRWLAASARVSTAARRLTPAAAARWTAAAHPPDRTRG